jgi:hypothetical protein
MAKKALKLVEPVIDQDLTDRMLLSLVFDITTLADDVEQVKNVVYGLARQRGLVKEAEAAA